MLICDIIWIIRESVAIYEILFARIENQISRTFSRKSTFSLTRVCAIIIDVPSASYRFIPVEYNCFQYRNYSRCLSAFLPLQ